MFGNSSARSVINRTIHGSTIYNSKRCEKYANDSRDFDNVSAAKVCLACGGGLPHSIYITKQCK